MKRFVFRRFDFQSKLNQNSTEAQSKLQDDRDCCKTTCLQSRKPTPKTQLATHQTRAPSKTSTTAAIMIPRVVGSIWLLGVEGWKNFQRNFREKCEDLKLKNLKLRNSQSSADLTLSNAFSKLTPKRHLNQSDDCVFRENFRFVMIFLANDNSTL